MLLSLNQNFDESRAFRVLVVPIGDNSMFDKHFEIISRHRVIPIFDLNRPSDWKAQSSPFKNFSWMTDNVIYDYLRYDRVVNGPGDLENFQSSRRILVIIGLINYPELENSMSRIDKDMEYYSRRHPNVIIRRYFVFNYSFEMGSLPPQLASGSDKLIVFPPEGECEGGSMIDVHTKEVMGNIAVRIFLSLESQMTACEEVRSKQSASLPTWLSLATTHDDVEDNGNVMSASDAAKRLKRRVNGRLRKWMGDQCAQVGSPIDAWENYSIAISECRNQNDFMWLAGALEGSIVAALAMIYMTGAEDILGKDLKPYLTSISGAAVAVEPAVHKMAEERMQEALSIYARNVALCGLEAEGCLHLARMFENSSHPEKEQKVMELIMRASSLPGLSVQQQIDCTLEGALLCHRLGLKRKYAFLLYVVALLSAESENTAVAHYLIRSACKQYGFVISDSDAGADSVEAESSHPGMWVKMPEKSWASMRCALFAHTAHFAKEFGDMQSTARSLTALLRLIGEMESKRHFHRRMWIPSKVVDAVEDIIASKMDSIAVVSPVEDDGVSFSSVDLTLRLINFPLNPSHNINGAGGVVDTYGLLGGGAYTGSVTAALSAAPQANANAGSPVRWRSRNLTASALSSFAGEVVMSMSDSMHSASREGEDSAAFSEVSDLASTLTSRFSIDAMKHSRGIISVPKMSPFVQTLVPSGLMQRKMTLTRAVSGRQQSIKSVDGIPQASMALSGINTGISNQNASQQTALYATTISPRVGSSNASVAPFVANMPSSPPIGLAPGDSSNIQNTGIASIADPTYRLGVPLDAQRHSLGTLSALCQRLPPSTPLFLGGIPSLVYLRPQPLKEEDRPIRLPVITDLLESRVASSSALFYDPFEAKRAKARNLEGSVAETIWVQNEVVHIEAAFANSLAVQVQLHNLQLVFESGEYTAFPVSIVVIPPETTLFVISLSARPRQSGVLKIQGISFSFFNAVHFCRVDSRGMGVNPISKEYSSPKAYPRSISSEKQKPIKHIRSASKIPLVKSISSSVSSAPSLVGHVSDAKWSGASVDIAVVEECASVRLIPSWAHCISTASLNLNHTKISSFDALSFPSSPSREVCGTSHTLNGAVESNHHDGLVLELFQGETRQERVVIENVSSSIEIIDLRVIAHVTLWTPKVSSTMPLSDPLDSIDWDSKTESLIITQFDASRKSQEKSDSASSNNINNMGNTLSAFSGSLVLAIKWSTCFPIKPLEQRNLDIDFSSLCQCKSGSIVRIQIDVDYISGGVNPAVSPSSSLESKSEVASPEDIALSVAPPCYKRALLRSSIYLSNSIRVSHPVPILQPCESSMLLTPELAQYSLSKISLFRSPASGGHISVSSGAVAKPIHIIRQSPMLFRIELLNDSPWTVQFRYLLPMMSSDDGEALVKYKLSVIRESDESDDKSLFLFQVEGFKRKQLLVMVERSVRCIDDVLLDPVAERDEVSKFIQRNITIQWTIVSHLQPTYRTVTRSGKLVSQECLLSDLHDSNYFTPFLNVDARFSLPSASEVQLRRFSVTRVPMKHFHKFVVSLDPRIHRLSTTRPSHVEVAVIVRPSNDAMAVEVSEVDSKESDADHFVLAGSARKVVPLAYDESLKKYSTVHHSVNVCFTASGSFVMHTLVRYKSADGTVICSFPYFVEEWWMQPRSYHIEAFVI